VVPAIVRCLCADARVLALVKPQFEVGKGHVGRSGVVRDPDEHQRVLTSIGVYLAAEGLSVLGLSWSPIRGPKGNIEFWLYLSKEPLVGYASEDIDNLSAQTVKEAHRELQQ